MTATKSVRGEKFFVAMKNFDWGRTAQESEHADRGTVNTGVGNRYEIAPLHFGDLDTSTNAVGRRADLPGRSYLHFLRQWK
ncbi:MAG: hypothetical protein ABF384_12675 [Verrucomicrobiales bacterium]